MQIMTMDRIPNSMLNRLIQAKAQNLVSIYMPTHPTGREQQQDPIRLKNMLAQADQRLESGGLRLPNRQAILRPAERLLSEPDFWQHQSQGLALFMTENFFEYFRIPQRVDELLVVGEHFHIKPLLRSRSRDQKFYILAVSQNEVRLLEGNKFNIWEMDLTDAPQSLQEALQYDDPERELQFHTSTDAPSVRGSRDAVYHGSGVGSEDEKNRLLRYFHKLDDGITAMLDGEHTPLVFAGVDYLFPIYQQANKYPGLMEEAVPGNPEELSTIDLHDRAWEIVEPLFRRERKEALERFQQLSNDGSGMASADLQEAVPAAYYGRVAILFAGLNEQTWGSFDAGKNRLTLHKQMQPDDMDVIDLAVVHTLLHDGDVFVMDQESVPGQHGLAAIYRYPLEPAE